MLVEEFDDEDSQPCPICGDDDNEDHLLICDGCSEEYHTYCVDLEEIPVGHWFCRTCSTQRAIDSVCPLPLQRSHHTADRRTRGQRRRSRRSNQVSSSGWARVWQSVWDRLNLDLDFPFEEGSNNVYNRSSQQAAQDRRQWERRLQVADRQPGRNRFWDTASTLLDLRATRERPPPPEPESNEEIRAWNALEKAKEIHLDPTPNQRKRKSANSSPSDEEPAPKQERPFKRPRTRRNMDLGESSVDAQSETSIRGRLPFKLTNSDRPEVGGALPGGNGLSFLQSLLNEVESSTAPDETKGQTRSSMLNTTGHSSPQVSSPGASPTTSNHASPRALSASPPPFRPGSPFFLTSRVEPIFPPPEFSPERSPGVVRRTRVRSHEWPYANIPWEDETSPTRMNMSFSTKSDVQKLVVAALKPYYKSNAVSKDQYTEINRNVSRMIYEKVGEKGSVNGDAKESWERLANNEVAKAVELLKSTT